MSEWKTTTLGDFISLQRGHDLPFRERRSGGIPVIGSGGITGYHDTAVASGPGIAIGRAANLGVPTLVQEDFWPLNTTLYVTDFHGNDVRFTYYLLQTLDLTGFNSGSVQPMLNRNYIRNFPVTAPDQLGQQAISAVLGALDDKIAINDRLAQSAFDIGEAMFIRLNSAATSIVSVADVIELKYGRSLPAVDRTEGKFPVYGSGGVSGTHDSALVEGPGVIVGRKGTVGTVYWSDGSFFPIDTTFYVEPRQRNMPLEFTFYMLRYLGLDSMNSDSAVPGLNRTNALALPIRMPNDADLQSFATVVRPLFALRQSLSVESSSLARIRSTLLPKLMSGEIRVRDAEKVVEGVT